MISPADDRIPPDLTVGGRQMATLSPRSPRGPIDVRVPGMAGFRWIHTPGHAPGHVSFWPDADRRPIVGDAFVTTAQESVYSVATQAPELNGPPMYYTPDWESARRSVERLAAPDPKIVVPGHGRAMRGPSMLEALKELARRFDEVAVPEHGRYVDVPVRADERGTSHAPS